MSTFLTAEWRKLIMAQYVVPPELLLPLLPSGVELDLYRSPEDPQDEGRCFVSLVAFLFDKVRLKGVPIPFHTRFEEINLRFYVRRQQPDGSLRRGVVFIREFVPRRAIARVARWLYEEPYTAVPAAHHIQHSARTLSVAYEWTLGGRSHRLSATASTPPADIRAGSEEEFLTEHYWGYTKRSRGPASEYAVQHPRWQTYSLQDYTIDVDFGVLYGPGFASLNGQPAQSVLLAEGSAVSVHSGTRLAE